MATLFDIDKAIMAFEFEIDEETGEIINADELDNLKMEREQKIENIGLYYKNIKAEAEMVKAEKNAMADRQRVLENKAESLKQYLAYALQGQKFSTGKVAVSFRKSKSVSIPDESKIADEWCVVTQVRKPDKTAIKEAIESGTKVAGAEIIEKNNAIVK